MKKEVIWNSFLAALMTAAFAIIGWLSLSVVKLQNQYAAESAEKMLRRDITDALNDVDKRLAVIEAVVVIRSGGPIQVSKEVIEPDPLPAPPAPVDPDDPDLPDKPEPDIVVPEMVIPQMPAPQVPRYDLRSQRSQRAP